MADLTLSQLNLFPVKSLRGIPVARWEVGARGFRMDRELMVVDGNGRAVTQREQRRMALLVPEITEDQLVVHAPASPPLTIPLGRRSRERVSVSLWKDTILAEPVGAEADDWLSVFLGEQVRLVRFADEVHRQVDPTFARAGDAVGFADGFSFLLLTEASVADLGARVGQPVAMARFRPNLVVQGSAPFAEDGWRRIRVGPIECELVKPCARCVMVNVDPLTAESGVEPLRTLATYRLADGKVFLGWNLVHRGTGTLQVGDTVEVVG